jgi:hypothetical protein
MEGYLTEVSNGCVHTFSHNDFIMAVKYLQEAFQKIAALSTPKQDG